MMKLVVADIASPGGHRLNALAVTRSDQTSNIERAHPTARWMRKPHQKRLKPSLQIDPPEVCASELRSGDVFARTGGEEFVFLLPCAAFEVAREIGNRLRAQVAACIVPTRQGDLSVTASFGIAHADPATTDLANALNRADLALYEAKNAGGDCVRMSA